MNCITKTNSFIHSKLLVTSLNYTQCATSATASVSQVLDMYCERSIYLLNAILKPPFKQYKISCITFLNKVDAIGP